jgi:hypothetical protein
MAINRGTRRETFLHFLEAFALLGALGGAGVGLLQTWGKGLPAVVTSVFQLGFMGFIAGSAVGIILGLLAVIIATIFR